MPTTPRQRGWNRSPLSIQLHRAPGSKKPGPTPHIENAAYRSRIIAVASTGMSRNGVAALAGVSIHTLRGYLERGRAYPDVEPYGSFARDYLQAERAKEYVANQIETLLVKRLYELVSEGRFQEIDLHATMRDLRAMLESRHPEDYGSSAHRVPETEPLGEAWVERNGLTEAQLGAMVCDPPEPLKLALVKNADAVYALLLSSGWAPKAMAAE